MKERKEKKEKKLAIFIGFIVVVIIAVLNVIQITFIAETTNKITEQTYIEECTELTKTYRDRIAGKIEEFYGLLYTYTSSDIALTGNTNQIATWLRNHASIRSEYFDYVAYVDKEGTFISDIGTQTNVLERSYYKDIMVDGKETTVDDPVTSKVSGKTVIHICRAVKVNGQNKGFFLSVDCCFDLERGRIRALRKGGQALLVAYVHGLNGPAL